MRDKLLKNIDSILIMLRAANKEKFFSYIKYQATPRQNGYPQKVGNQAQECPNHDIWCLRVQENHELKSSHCRNFFAQNFRNPGGGSNPVPLDPKSTALPIDPRRQKISGAKFSRFNIKFYHV